MMNLAIALSLPGAQRVSLRSTVAASSPSATLRPIGTLVEILLISA
jgi:hypothetical protein